MTPINIAVVLLKYYSITLYRKRLRGVLGVLSAKKCVFLEKTDQMVKKGLAVIKNTRYAKSQLSNCYKIFKSKSSKLVSIQK